VTPLLLPDLARDLEDARDAVERAARRCGWDGRRAVFVSRDRVWTEVL
jgi:hypothetical protein